MLTSSSNVIVDDVVNDADDADDADAKDVDVVVLTQFSTELSILFWVMHSEIPIFYLETKNTIEVFLHFLPIWNMLEEKAA